MLRDSRIVHIIDLLGELRELLLVIDQAGDTAPAILLKLAKEKAEEITRSTRELRQPECTQRQPVCRKRTPTLVSVGS